MSLFANKNKNCNTASPIYNIATCYIKLLNVIYVQNEHDYVSFEHITVFLLCKVQLIDHISTTYLSESSLFSAKKKERKKNRRKYDIQSKFHSFSQCTFSLLSLNLYTAHRKKLNFYILMGNVFSGFRKHIFQIIFLGQK